MICSRIAPWALILLASPPLAFAAGATGDAAAPASPAAAISPAPATGTPHGVPGPASYDGPAKRIIENPGTAAPGAADSDDDTLELEKMRDIEESILDAQAVYPLPFEQNEILEGFQDPPSAGGLFGPGWVPPELRTEVVEPEFDALAPSGLGDALWLDIPKDQFDIPIEFNPQVERFIAFFTGPGRKYFTRWLERSGRFIPMLRPIIREYGLPEDTIYLAMIESGFSPYAYSWARASGVWQFIQATGQEYGLTINFWVDERRDPIKATRAAMLFLNDLYGRFSDWRLSWAAYNAGGARIVSAIRKTGQRDFWLMDDRRYLRTETRHYVPKLMAAVIISKKPARCGFTDINYQEPLAFEEVEVEGAITLEAIAKASGATLEIIEELNPHFRRGCTPPGRKTTVRLPAGGAARFREGIAAIPPEERMPVNRHKVKKGESIHAIAAAWRTRPEAIEEFNPGAGKSPEPGDELLVPVLPKSAPDVMDRHVGRRGRGRWVPRSAYNYTPDPALAGKTHSIRRGENLWSIATRYNLPVEELMRLNGLSPDDTRGLKVGQTLRLGGPAGGKPAAKAQPPAAAPASGGKSAAGPAVGPGQRHVVQSGDNLWDISQKYGVTVAQIREWNRLGPRSRLYPGQTLRVSP